MSVYTLDYPKAVVGIPDEMEAFFHVVLFYAVRFLRHNCTDVAQFMHNYFDDYQTIDGELVAGMAKSSAMAFGEIRLPRQQKLLFYHSHIATDSTDEGASSTVQDDPSSIKHPLGNILDALLELFKARYALMTITGDAAEDPPTLSQPIPPADEIDAWFAQTAKGYVSATKQVAEKSKRLAKQRKSYEQAAAQLESYDEVIALLCSFFNNDAIVWPKNDKVPDQRRSDWHPVKDAPKVALEPNTISTTSQGARSCSMDPRTRSLGLPPVPSTASVSGTKRYNTADDDDDGDEPSAPKRNRSQMSKNPGAVSKSGKGRSRS